MKKVIGASLALFLGVAVFSAVARAGPFRTGMFMRHDGAMAERYVERTLQKLEVTDGQRAEIEAIAEAYRPRLQEMRREMRAQGLRLFDATPSDAGYQATVEETSNMASAMAREAIELTSSMRVEIYAVLDEAQRRKAAEMKGDLRERIVDFMAVTDPEFVP